MAYIYITTSCFRIKTLVFDIDVIHYYVYYRHVSITIPGVVHLSSKGAEKNIPQHVYSETWVHLTWVSMAEDIKFRDT